MSFLYLIFLNIQQSRYGTRIGISKSLIVIFISITIVATAVSILAYPTSVNGYYILLGYYSVPMARFIAMNITN